MEQHKSPLSLGAGGNSRITGGNVSNLTDETNQLMHHQMMHNILETINTVSNQYQIPDDEAFEKIFFEWSGENLVREQVIEGNDEINMKDFTSTYAKKLIVFNNQYMMLRENREKYLN
mmetsp:Transcript_31191/g.30620  ORF Transcript_31191/g.30620 Transcript_31191/m.30620 type:complete len:118 (+) Transcript_31191:48-401(+)